MNLGRTLVGGIIGAAVAIGIYVALMLGTGQSANWFPVVTGALVGFGVMQACKTAGNVSYARGAVSGLIAAGAILGSDYVAKEVLTRKAAAVSAKAGPEKKADSKDEDAEEGEAEAAEVEEEVTASEPPKAGDIDPDRGAIGAPKQLGQNDVWPFAFMAIGIFLAYEFARGKAPKTAAAEGEEPAPAVDEEEEKEEA